MNSDSNANSSRLVRKLESITDLSEDERQAIHELPMAVRTLAADTDIVRDGDRPSECCLILEGFACRYKLVAGGSRQIMAFHIPGDMPDLLSLHLRVLDHSLGTLVPTKAAFIRHVSLRRLIERHPRIGAAFWRDTLIDAGVFREWMVGIGRRSAHARIAHLLCELLVRLRAVGLTRDHSYGLPMTQADLGDALGLSTVHVNRVLQDLRRDGLITLRNGCLTVQDWEGLKRAGDFDPTYLHLQSREAA